MFFFSCTQVFVFFLPHDLNFTAYFRALLIPVRFFFIFFPKMLLHTHLLHFSATKYIQTWGFPAQPQFPTSVIGAPWKLSLEHFMIKRCAYGQMKARCPSKGASHGTLYLDIFYHFFFTTIFSPSFPPSQHSYSHIHMHFLISRKGSHILDQQNDENYVLQL